MALNFTPENPRPAPLSHSESFFSPPLSPEAFRRLIFQGPKEGLRSADFAGPDFIYPFPPDSYQRIEVWVGQMDEWQREITRVENAFKKVASLNAELEETRGEVDEIFARFLRADWLIANAIAADVLTSADAHELSILIDDWSEDMEYLSQVAVELEALPSH